MTFEDMQSFLNGIQSEKAETKIMNALLSCYQEVKNHEKMIIELQEKVNEIAKNWNNEIEGVEDAEVNEATEEENEAAEALNPDIEEDEHQEDIIDECTGSADSNTQEVE